MSDLTRGGLKRGGLKWVASRRKAQERSLEISVIKRKGLKRGGLKWVASWGEA
jgi:hypothetical protein